MSRQKMLCGLVLCAAAVVMLGAVPAHAAGVATTGLAVWLDAADFDADTVPGLGAGTVWSNKVLTRPQNSGTLMTTGSGTATWAGSGTVADPYQIQLRQGAGDTGGLVQVENSYDTAPSDIGPTQTFTREVWMKTAGLSTTGGEIWGQNGSGAGNGPGGICQDATGALKWQGASTNQDLGVNLASTWHQYVVTRAGSGASDTVFYMDGVQVGAAFASGWIDPNAGAGSIGGFLALGAIDYTTGTTPVHTGFNNIDVGVARDYIVALSASDVLGNYNADRGTFGLPAAVPEPSAVIILVTGLIGLFCYAWRKRK
jgi:hypothetical protein